MERYFTVSHFTFAQTWSKDNVGLNNISSKIFSNMFCSLSCPRYLLTLNTPFSICSVSCLSRNGDLYAVCWNWLICYFCLTAECQWKHWVLPYVTCLRCSYYNGGGGYTQLVIRRTQFLESQLQKNLLLNRNRLIKYHSVVTNKYLLHDIWAAGIRFSILNQDWLSLYLPWLAGN